MTLTLAGIAGDAWARWRRDRTVLLALAGPFLFLPLFAWLLLVPQPVLAPDAADADRFRALVGYMGDNLHWLALRIGVELFGTATVFMLYLSGAHDDVGALLRRTLALLPMFVVTVVASWGLIALGFLAFILPGCYVYGRVCLTGAVLAAEPDAGLAGAITRSFALTQGRGWQVFGYVVLPLLVGLIAAQFLGGVAEGLRVTGVAHPAALALLEGLVAAAVAASALARALLEVSLYRRLARPRHGV